MASYTISTSVCKFIIHHSTDLLEEILYSCNVFLSMNDEAKLQTPGVGVDKYSQKGNKV